jgi:hypothetical protein
MADPNVPTQLAPVALDVDASTIRRFELALKQEILVSSPSVPSGRASNDTSKYSSPALATDTYGNDNSAVTAVTSRRVVRHVIACRWTGP